MGGVGAVVPPLDILANQAPRRFDGKLGPTLFGAVANWAPADWANLYKVPVPVEFIDWYWTFCLLEVSVRPLGAEFGNVHSFEYLHIF